VIAIAPVGAGRLLVSGALDAWRYRANASAAFDRFWQATIAGLAMSTRPAIDVEALPSVVAPGDDVRLRVRVRRSASRASSPDGPISGKIVDTDTPIRLWPDASSNAFHASFAAPRGLGVHRAAVTMAEHTATAAFIVAADARTARPNGPPLVMLAESHGGIDVAADRIPELVQRLRRDIAAPTVREERRPMRSIWWMLPFAACLGAEWWLRRRRGLR
jgi:hypothetical protein